jgi:hypothetical protein
MSATLVAALLVAVAVAVLLRERSRGAKMDPPVSAAESVNADSILPSNLRASFEREGPIDAVLAKPSLWPDPGKKPQLLVSGDDLGVTYRSSFVHLTEMQGSQLRESLVGVGPTTPTDCTFMPDVVFRFGTDPDSVRVVVCHGCLEAMVLTTARPIRRYALQSGSDPLLALTADLFPDDARIADYRSQRAGR